MSDIQNVGKKGSRFGWFMLYFFMFVLLCIYIYRYNSILVFE